jgi:hypothetical protein
MLVLMQLYQKRVNSSLFCEFVLRVMRTTRHQNNRQPLATQTGAVIAETAVAIFVLMAILVTMLYYTQIARERNKIQKALLPVVRILGAEQICEGDPSPTQVDIVNRINSAIFKAEGFADLVLTDDGSKPEEVDKYWLSVALTADWIEDSSSYSYYLVLAIKRKPDPDGSDDAFPWNIKWIQNLTNFGYIQVPISKRSSNCLNFFIDNTDYPDLIIKDTKAFINSIKEETLA